MSSAAASLTIDEDAVTIAADYGLFDDEDQKTISETGEFTIKNEANESKTVDITFSGLPADYAANDIVGLVINADSSKKVSFSLEIPHSQDSGNTTIGTVQVKDSTTKELLFSRNVIQETKSMLALDELEVRYISDKGTAEKDVFTEDKEEYELVDEVKPGEEVQLIFTLENLFDKDYDEDDSVLEEIELKIDGDSDLFQAELDDSYDIDNILADKKQEFTFSFIVGNKAENEKYTLEIEIVAEDGNNLKHSIKRDLTLEVKREQDDVRITKVELNPKKVTCEDTVQFTVDLTNQGTRNQKFTALSVYGEELKVNEQINDFELERFSQDNVWEHMFKIKLPEGLAVGSYALDVTAFIDRDRKMDATFANVIVNECATENAVSQPADETGTVNEKTDKEETESTTNENTMDTSATVIDSSTIVKSVEDPYTADDMVVAMMIVVIIVALTFIALFMIILLRDSRR